MKIIRKTRARIKSIQVIYSYLAMEENFENVLQNYLKYNSLSENNCDIEYFHLLINNCISKIDVIIEKISSVLWSWKSQSLMLKSILICGTIESIVMLLPISIAVNEYIEIARLFGLHDSTKVIHLILDEMKNIKLN